MAKNTEEKKNTKASKPKKGFFRSITKFFRESKAEFKKVVWPTKKQLLNHSIVVISFVLATGVFVCLIDIIFTAIIGLLY